MAHRSPARWLAPLALVVFAIALVIVLGSGSSTSEKDASTGTAKGTPAGSAKSAAKPKATATAPKAKTVYVVKLGDTPSQIAAETGVPLEQIERLNPDLDPQLLAPGDKIRLR